MLSLLEKHGIVEPTTIQKEIIPAIVQGRDVLAQSETGSGKTLSFAIPIIEDTKKSDGLTALILVPTRELCVQVAGEFIKYSDGKHLSVATVYGGVSISNQTKKMKKVNIIVATPGRLIDLLGRNAVNLEVIKYLVLDEADRMLDMGFIKDIERILKHIPEKKQTLLFSATVSKEIAQLSQKYLDNPVYVTLESKVKPEFLQQTYYQITQEQKIPLLVQLLKQERDLALVFCNRKHITAKLAKKLSSQGVNAKCLHGDMSQPQREKVTADFRNKKINILIATDVAARGLHIEDITHVYNFEIPRDVESYTHRVGRTARAGKKGEAVSFVATDEEKKFFKQILFTYSGSITLKRIDGLEIPQQVQEVAQPKTQQPSAQKRQRPEPRQDKRREPKRPHQKPDKEYKRRESGSKERNASQRDGRKPSQKDFRREPRTETRPKESKIWFGKREEPSSSNRYYKQQSSSSSGKSNDGRYKREGYSPRDRNTPRRDFNQPPRKRSNFRQETYQAGPENLPPSPDDKKKKRNWKEMWERLIGE